MDDGLIQNCHRLIEAYKTLALGNCRMPEDAAPIFHLNQTEERLAFFTLPMALNYQRDSYKLWEAATKAWNDPTTHGVFVIEQVVQMSTPDLRSKLLKHKVALQPNKHVATWQTIARTVQAHWKDLNGLMFASNQDFLFLQKLIQQDHKKGFPYLSGPKIFHYWSFILSTYGKIPLKNRDAIEIAPDTHITKCSVKLGVITAAEAETWPREKISARWRERLAGSGIDPIDMHPPLWFWSRNDFQFKL